MPFSIAAAPFYIPADSAQGFQFLHTLTNTCYCVFCFLFDSSHSSRCDVLTYISLMISDVEDLSRIVGRLYIFFGGMSIQVPSHLKKKPNK